MVLLEETQDSTQTPGLLDFICCCFDFPHTATWGTASHFIYLLIIYKGNRQRARKIDETLLFLLAVKVCGDVEKVAANKTTE